MFFFLGREEKAAAAAAKSGGSGESSESVATIGTSMPPTATSTPGVNPFTSNYIPLKIISAKGWLIISKTDFNGFNAPLRIRNKYRTLTQNKFLMKSVTTLKQHGLKFKTRITSEVTNLRLPIGLHLD
jgi:hypothetical protein